MSQNTLNAQCKASGHAWSLSPSGTFRTCNRDYCPAVEHLVDGTWRDARPSRKSLKAHVPLVGRQGGSI